MHVTISQDRVPPIIREPLLNICHIGNAYDLIDYCVFVENPDDPKYGTGWWEGHRSHRMQMLDDLIYRRQKFNEIQPRWKFKVEFGDRIYNARDDGEFEELVQAIGLSEDASEALYSTYRQDG